MRTTSSSGLTSGSVSEALGSSRISSRTSAVEARAIITSRCSATLSREIGVRGSMSAPMLSSALRALVRSSRQLTKAPPRFG